MCSGSVLELHYATPQAERALPPAANTHPSGAAQDAFIMKPPQEIQLALAILCVYMSVELFQMFLKPQEVLVEDEIIHDNQMCIKLLAPRPTSDPTVAL